LAYTDYERMNRDRVFLLIVGINFTLTAFLMIFTPHVNKIGFILCSGLGITSIATWFIFSKGKTYKKYLEIRQKEMEELAYKCRVNAEIAIMEQDL